MRHFFRFSFSFFLLASTVSLARAQEVTDAEVNQEVAGQISADVLNNSYLKDLNGDGQIIIDAFGDSITRGRGDFIAPGEFVTETAPITEREAGYPLRIELSLGISVTNKGVSGDIIVGRGLRRFAEQIPGSASDLVVISGGSNDAFSLTSSSDISRTIQTMINIVQASGKQAVLATIPPSCCDRSGLELFILEYNRQYEHLSAVNDLPLARVHQAYQNTCTSIEDCELLNRPEGLHPNTIGYDVSGEAVIAALLKIDLLSPQGAKDYESALDLQPGSVRTVPNAVDTPATEQPVATDGTQAI